MMADSKDVVDSHNPMSRATDTSRPVQERCLRVADLMGNEKHVILEHAGEHYVLRITAKGRLILTK